ncbi:MAG TPA: ABC transporter permease, partial [Gemmataceae bacterium]|nr:ABC transporter permease [Gemmataceae bacterium]
MNKGQITVACVCIICIALPPIIVRHSSDVLTEAKIENAKEPVPDAEKRKGDHKAETLVLLLGPGSSSSVNFGKNIPESLTIEDADAIQKMCSAVADVAPVVRARTKVIHGDHAWAPLFVYGTSSQFLKARGRQDLAAGRAFTKIEAGRSEAVSIIIGQTIVEELFEGQPALGQEMKVGDIATVIVGILDRAGTDDFGLDQDDVVLMPLGTVIEHLRKTTQPS